MQLHVADLAINNESRRQGFQSFSGVSLGVKNLIKIFLGQTFFYRYFSSYIIFSSFQSFFQSFFFHAVLENPNKFNK